MATPISKGDSNEIVKIYWCAPEVSGSIFTKLDWDTEHPLVKEVLQLNRIFLPPPQKKSSERRTSIDIVEVYQHIYNFLKF